VEWTIILFTKEGGGHFRSGMSGLEWWTGMVDWNGGLEWWTGTVEE